VVEVDADPGSEDRADGVAPRAHRPVRRTWQKAEDRVAAFFGVRRQLCSGSSGRDDVTASDSTHPVLFVETKYRKCHTVRTRHDEVKERARKEKKTPVLALVDKNREGFLLGIHSDNFLTVAAEVVAILDDEGRAEFDSRIVKARARWGDSQAGDGSGSWSGPVEGDPVEPVENNPVESIEDDPDESTEGDPIEKAPEGP
jgi:hypothetical protein